MDDAFTMKPAKKCSSAFRYSDIALALAILFMEIGGENGTHTHTNTYISLPIYTPHDTHTLIASSASPET